MPIFQPTNQTTYNTPVDQRAIQQTYSTNPAVYLTRILHRLSAATYGTGNAVLSGLDVSYAGGIGTNTVTFSISPGSVMVDSAIVDLPSAITISTDAIPVSSPSKLQVGIFASFNFSTTAPTNLSFTSYVFDMSDNLVAPLVFGGNEKVLIAVFNLDLSGANMVASNRISDWIEIGNAATLAGTGARLHVTNTQNYPGYAYTDTTIPSGTVCDFTADVVSGNASVKVGNTVPNSAELVNLSSTTPATLTSSFTTTSNNQTIALGNSTANANDVAVFDNVQVEYPLSTNLLSGDDSTFAGGIGNWVSSQNNSAYWDGVGALVIAGTTHSATYDLAVGSDITANTTYTLSTTGSTSISVVVGTAGASSNDLLSFTPTANVEYGFTSPASGTVTITITSTAANGSINDLLISESAVGGDSAFFTTTVGSWGVTGTATAVSTTGSLVVTNVAGTAADTATLVVNVTPNQPYALDFNIISLSGSTTVAIGTTAGASDIVTNAYTTAGYQSAQFTPTVSTVYITITPQLVANGAITIDNFFISKDVSATVLPGDNSSFATSIGNWAPSAYSASSTAGVLELQNIYATAAGSELSVSQTISLAANFNYQFELTGVTQGTFQVLDGATVVASATADGVVKFTTTAATSYALKYFNNVLTVGGIAQLGNVNIFRRVNALTNADSTFTSIANWKTTAFDNVYYSGNGLRIVDQLAFGAEVSRTISGLTSGTVYRVQVEGDSNAQILIGAAVGDGSLLTATGVVDSVFTANATTAVVTLRVNSNVVNAEADFKNIKIFEDNTHTVQSSLSYYGLGSSSIRSLSVNNPNRRLSNSITVGGTEYVVGGTSPQRAEMESAALSLSDSGIGALVADIPRIKPTKYNLPYHITSVLF